MWKTYGFPKAIESRKKRGFSRSRSDVYPRVVIQMFGDVWWMFLLFLKYCWWWHVNIWCLPVFCMYVFLCSKFPDFMEISWKYPKFEPLMWTLRVRISRLSSAWVDPAAGHRCLLTLSVIGALRGFLRSSFRPGATARAGDIMVCWWWGFITSFGG